MSREVETTPFTHVRRRDRAVTDDAWIRALLRQAAFGALATMYQSQPFINSNLFVFDEAANAIYLHTARVGRTRANIEQNDRVCFSVSQMGRLLPAKEALEFSVEYAGVTVFGCATIVTKASEAEHGLQLLLNKYAPHLKPGKDYRPITPAELKRTAVYRIDIEEWSGKKKEAAADFPGAFRINAADMEHVQEYCRDDHLISTNRSKLDIDFIHDFLAHHSYWASGISKDKVVRYLKHSLCFGVYAIEDENERQIGFARVLPDFTVYAHVADLFIEAAYRGRGLGKWLVESMLAHPELQDVRRWTLNTRDAQGLYAQFGFRPEPNPEGSLLLRRDLPR